MRKLDSLRAALAAALPELAQDPTRLKIWIEKGAAQSRQTQTRAFALSYQANVLIEDLATDIAVVMLAVFDWLRINQSVLLAPGTDGLTFDVDLLDNSLADIELRLDLTENVSVQPRPDGGADLVWLPEPAPLFADDAQLGPLLTGVDTVTGIPL